MKTISVPYQGKVYKLSYTVETIDLNATQDFLNVYTVFVKDEQLKKLLGEHFSILHNQLQNPTPSFEMKSSGSIDEINLKKEIAQQIINNPGE